MLKPQEVVMLSTLYNESHRRYHNINHIHQCLAELEQYQTDHPNVNDFNINQLNWCTKALWYHDAIYNPYSKENEHLSALLFEQMNHGYDGFNIVSDAISLTAEHLKTHDFTAMDKTDPEASLVLKIVLDIDLSGFGQNRMIYAQNSLNIRDEYYNTTMREFLNGRLKFLEAIANRATLYYTKYFYDKYHEKSQKNLHWEIQLIKDSFDKRFGIVNWDEQMVAMTSEYRDEIDTDHRTW